MRSESEIEMVRDREREVKFVKKILENSWETGTVLAKTQRSSHPVLQELIGVSLTFVVH